MTADEYTLLLIEGLTHVEADRGEFYIREANKRGTNPVNAFNGLHEAYKRIEAEVNSQHYDTWYENAAGEKTFPYKTINLLHLTGGRINGTLTKDNSTELLTGLLSMGEMTQRIIEPKPSKKGKIKTEPQQPATFESLINDSNAYEKLIEILMGKKLLSDAKIWTTDLIHCAMLIRHLAIKGYYNKPTINQITQACRSLGAIAKEDTIKKSKDDKENTFYKFIPTKADLLKQIP